MELHDIGWAIRKVRLGEAIYRRGWNGKNQYLVFHEYPVDSNHLPWISITTVEGDIVPWTASQTDLLAEDWELVKHFDE